MRLFAALYEANSVTGAAVELGVSKQTVSRRLAQLEEALGAQLVHRTTRVLSFTETGRAYAERCVEIVRLAVEANDAVLDRQDEPAGTLRITADPLFGESFLGPLVLDYAKRWPDVELEVILTRRHVDLVAEGFDVAFRIGGPKSADFPGINIGAAQVCYCAAPSYLARKGEPVVPEDLARHDCVLLLHDGHPPRWPFRGPSGIRRVSVGGRLRFTSFKMVHEAVRDGMGIAIFPAFACANDLAEGRLVAVLADHAPEVGGIQLLTPTRRFLSARVRRFIDLATAAFSD